MTNCIFYSIFFALFINLSFGSLRFSQINRSFLSIYKGMLEACVLTVDEDGEPVKPYYSHEKIDEYVVNYLNESIKRYSNSYSLTTEYYDENFKEKTDTYSRGIAINLKAKIYSYRTYEKEQRFSISSKENAWTNN